MRYVFDRQVGDARHAFAEAGSRDLLRSCWRVLFAETAPAALQTAADGANRIFTDATDTLSTIAVVLDERTEGILEPTLPYLVSWIRCMTDLDDLWIDRVSEASLRCFEK